MALLAILWGISLLACGLAWSQFRAYAQRKQMPPGPPGLPIFGNLFQLSRDGVREQLSLWSKQYGAIFSLNMLGKHVVVINDFATTADLFGRKSVLYSDRPRLIVAHELCCDSRNPAFIQYGEHWRRMRKAGHEGFNITAVTTYRPLQEEYAVRLVSALLTDPVNRDAHIRRSAASTILSIVYGWPPLDASKDAIVAAINDWVHKLSRAAMPGTHLVDLFPWMQHLPAWAAPWKAWAAAQERQDAAMFRGFLDEIQANPPSQPTWAVQLVKDKERLGLEYKDVAWLTGGYFGAGAETSSGTVRAFLLAMVLYPDAMQRAQAEIDRVVGRGRLPTFADQSSLPFVAAVVKEVMRWRPVVPLGLPRRVVQDDWYNGYLIPEGTIVIQNIWAMNHDPELFTDPDAFRPERYLTIDGSALAESIPNTIGLGHAGFGAGRRICCGKDLANQSLFINIASILWAFDVQRAVNERGEPILPSPHALHDNGVVVEPAPFECVLKPRGEEVKEVVEGLVKQMAEMRE